MQKVVEQAARECGGTAALGQALELLAELQGERPPATSDEALLELHAQLRPDDVGLQQLIEGHLVERYRLACGHLAARAAARMPLSCDELYAAGQVGLLDAIRRFDPAKRVKFSTFAQHKIGFAMKDYARDVDHAPRLMRQRGTAPDVASLEAWADSLQGPDERPVDRAELIEYEQHPAADPARRRFAWRLLRGVSREAAVAIALRFLAGWTQSHIGDLLGVGESRVSQMVTEGLAELRERYPATDLFDQLRAAERGCA